MIPKIFLKGAWTQFKLMSHVLWLCTIDSELSSQANISAHRYIMWSRKWHADGILLVAKNWVTSPNFHFSVFKFAYEFSQTNSFKVLKLFEESFKNTIKWFNNWLLWIISSESLHIKENELKVKQLRPYQQNIWLRYIGGSLCLVKPWWTYLSDHL